MAKSLRLVRFTNWRHLKHLSREVLKKLVGPFVTKITGRGIALPSEDLEDKDYYTQWTGVFADPATLPEELTETLITIDEMSTETAHENLMEQMEMEGLTVPLGDKPTAMEVAVQVFLEKPDFLKAKHAEERLRSLRSFVHFLPPVDVRAPDFMRPPDADLEKFGQRLKPFFKKKVKGEFVDVTCHEMDGEFWFIILHGDIMTRTLEVKNDVKSNVLRYRPETDDVLVYNPGSNSVRVNAGSGGERKEYAKLFGEMFFADTMYFKLGSKYTFDPVKSGREVFNDVEVDGIDEVILREVRVFRGWDKHAVVTVRADDVFDLVERNLFPIAENTVIQKVSLDFVFSGDKDRPRPVKIVDENTASLARACDNALVEKWLNLAGFIRSAGKNDD
jgi:hypothetical protein